MLGGRACGYFFDGIMRLGQRTLIFPAMPAFFLAWHSLYFLIDYAVTTRSEHEALARLEQEVKILTLRARVAPHFRFNAFNIMLAELDRGPAGVAPIIENLSEYFRSSQRNRTSPFIPLGEEYEGTVNYLTVEQARFPDTLYLVCRTDPATCDLLVPG